MLPGAQGLSSIPVPADFLEPRDRPYDPLVCAEFGGAALDTPTQSRIVRIWVAYYEAGTIYVAPDDGLDAPVALVSDPDVETVSLAFDALMKPTLAYMTGGVAKLRWFDSTVNAIVTTTFSDVDSCQVTTDDKRPSQIGKEDVIFAYTRNHALCYRMQRERYTIEHVLKSHVPGTLQRVGMNEKNRLQFET